MKTTIDSRPGASTSNAATRAVSEVVLSVMGLLDAQQTAAQQVGDYVRRFAASMVPALEAIARGVAHLESTRPPNWPSVLLYPQLRALMEEGFPVVWVPPAEILTELLRKGNLEEKIQVLVDREAELIEHGLTVLAEITDPELVLHAELMRQALECLPYAPAAAQGLSLQIATLTAQSELESKSLGKLRKDLEKRARYVASDWSDLMYGMSILAVAPLLGNYHPDGPVPSTPNRHAVSHSISFNQYTRGNAVWSALVAVGVIRQAQYNRTMLRIAPEAELHN